jgi:hypothetical protein
MILMAERLELSDSVHGCPMQIKQPNVVRSSNWLGISIEFIRGVESQMSTSWHILIARDHAC